MAEKASFTDEAVLESITISFPISQSVNSYFNYFSRFFSRKKLYFEGTSKVVLVEKNQRETFPLPVYGGFPSVSLIVSTTSLVPTSLFILFLLFVLISKQVLILGRFISLHILWTSVENVSKDNIKDFKLGQHLGTVLGVFVAILKLIQEFLT
ncbi:MAG: hypothetical protein AAFW00_00005 [Bacteroidota bacterium]